VEGWPLPWAVVSSLAAVSGTFSPQITIPSGPEQTDTKARYKGGQADEGVEDERRPSCAGFASKLIRPERSSGANVRSQVSLKLCSRWQFRGGVPVAGRDPTSAYDRALVMCSCRQPIASGRQLKRQMIYAETESYRRARQAG